MTTTRTDIDTAANAGTIGGVTGTACAAAHVALALTACLVLSACSDEEPPTPSEVEAPAQPASTQRIVLPGYSPPAHAADLQNDAQIGPGVPAADAESLQQLMSNSGFETKFIRLSAPGEYTINVWGSIPHAATEFKIRRVGSEWQIVGDSPWVLISRSASVESAAAADRPQVLRTTSRRDVARTDC